MQLEVTDLKAYTQLLNRPDLWDVWLPPSMDHAFYEACQQHLLSSKNRFRLFRGIGVCRFFRKLAKNGVIAPVKVKLHPFRKGYAYMLDKGEVHVMAHLLFRSGYGEFVAAILHETAHVLLSQLPGYPNLLALDARFAETYLKGQHNRLLKTVTPVEFYAQVITVWWFRTLSAGSCSPKTKEIPDTESQKIGNKLNSAIALLNQISFS